MKLETILFPTDFSPGSDIAARYARDLAAQYAAELIVIHVYYDVIEGTGWYAPQIPLHELSDEVEQSAKEQLRMFCEANFSGMTHVTQRVLKGVAYQEIQKAAEEQKADLIIVGTHGRTGFDRVLFGSTAERVVRGASCPVLTVRLPPHRSSSF